MLLDPHARIHEVALNALGSKSMPGSMRWLSMLLDPHARIHEVALNALGSTWDP